MNDHPSKWYLFFDDGGVLNDNEVRGHQWKEILPEFFISRFGGTTQIWSRANHRVMNELIRNLEQRWINQQRPEDFHHFWDEFMTDWVSKMFNFAGIPLPDVDYVTLYKEVSNYVIPRVRSANRGVPDTLLLLRERGFNLYTASGELSWELEKYLTGMGCKDLFSDSYYGPDLINEGKFSSLFFRKIFQDVGIQPSYAIIIDDNPYFLKYAQEAGASIIQSYINGVNKQTTKKVVYHFHEIPNRIYEIINC